jgi:hypothetical protein
MKSILSGCGNAYRRPYPCKVLQMRAVPKQPTTRLIGYWMSSGMQRDEDIKAQELNYRTYLRVLHKVQDN